MNRERWLRIEELLQGALDRPAAARANYLDEASGGDKELKAEVLDMLARLETEPDFLDTPLVSLPGAASPQPAMSELERIGPYRVVRELGAGGMGVVYLAIHEGPGFERPVALKIIKRGLDTDDLLRRFQLERRILAALRHPNIAHFVDAGATPDGRPYFVMDFVEGVSIDVYCEREQLPVRKRLRLMIQVCAAVQHAHNNLIVHRDLKPGNILVANDGTPVLLDFGIGKLVDPFEAKESSQTATGIRAFTPEYASPEQLRGEPVSTATDVYGLGLMLYQLLTKRRPFDPGSGFAYEKAVMDTDPPRPSSFGNDELAGDIDTIILKALRKEPERRYSSVAALSDDIQRYLDGLPVGARPDTFGYRSGKFIRRHRLPLAAATIVFASLVGATMYSRAQTRAVTRERDKALEVQIFLLEMFGSTGQGHADSVSVRQMLDAQAAQVPIAYASDPELRAQMLMVVAEGYDRLGLFAQAEPVATEALATRRRTLRDNHADIAAAASLLGWIQYERGRPKEGAVLLREALDRWPRARPKNPIGYARTMNDLGVLVESTGGYEEAADLYRRALSVRRLTFGDSNRSVAITASNLSVVLYRKGDLKGAVAMAEQALIVMRRASGPDHQRSTLIQSNLASMRAQLGDVSGAEGEYRDLLARQIRVSGNQHPVTAVSQLGLASVLRAQGKYAEAESNLLEALASLEKAYGKEHPRVANALTALGGVRGAMGRYKEARPMLERALAIQRKLRGPAHRDVALALSALGALSGDAGDWAAAERTQREAVGIMEKAQGAQHLETASLRARLARAVYMRGRYEEALTQYRAAHEAMLKAGVQPTNALLLDTKLRVAQSLIALKRSAEADSVLRSVPDSGTSKSQTALRDSLRSRLGNQ
jgi:serine/threonine protein kinase/tetratricopeptide (TPR) repeat protein